KAKQKLLELFKKQGKHAQIEARIPPGQRLTPLFPVLDLGVQPEMDLNSWKLKITGLIEKPCELSLAELRALGTQEFVQDFHCVTSWSKLDVHWTGVSMKKLLDYVKPAQNWKHLIQYGADGYSTNVPREDVEKDTVFLAFALNGKPIPKEHGYVRLIIPQLYAWKTSKFLTQLEFSSKDKPGFWEVRGYHNHGDAWKEERYA
ncbi:MAG: molybdopterin-dependent oxidoreductase, partial [Candidatus Woesearchaeota archaeon]|nr:molybdopterin-dependent oxidoreductase [Candidatus Woesearchaeota archaeon]